MKNVWLNIIIFWWSYTLDDQKGCLAMFFCKFFWEICRKKLALINNFYNTFDEKHTSSSEYRHALLFMDTLKLEKVREYHSMYLKSDMFLKASEKHVMRVLDMICVIIQI